MRLHLVARSPVTWLVAAGVLVCLTGCSQDVLIARSFADSLARKDLGATLGLMSADATLSLDGVRYSGQEEIRVALQGLSASALTDEARDGMQLQGDKVTWPQSYSTSYFDALGVHALEAQVEATLAQGKIAHLQWELTPGSVEKIRAARVAQVAGALSAFEAAVSQRNVEQAQRLLAAARVEWLGRALEGAEQIAPWLAELVAPDSVLERVGESHVVGDAASWQARLTTAELTQLKVAPLDVTAKLETREGKITLLSVQLGPDAAARLEVARAQALPAEETAPTQED